MTEALLFVKVGEKWLVDPFSLDDILDIKLVEDHPWFKDKQWVVWDCDEAVGTDHEFLRRHLDGEFDQMSFVHEAELFSLLYKLIDFRVIDGWSHYRSHNVDTSNWPDGTVTWDVWKRYNEEGKKLFGREDTKLAGFKSYNEANWIAYEASCEEAPDYEDYCSYVIEKSG